MEPCGVYVEVTESCTNKDPEDRCQSGVPPLAAACEALLPLFRLWMGFISISEIAPVGKEAQRTNSNKQYMGKESDKRGASH
jgi:hypothetical protein